MRPRPPRRPRRRAAATAAKLQNPQFTEKAPEDVVDEVRAKSVQLEERRAALARSLERLRGMEA